jgi:hypothetical protein
MVLESVPRDSDSVALGVERHPGMCEKMIPVFCSARELMEEHLAQVLEHSQKRCISEHCGI